MGRALKGGMLMLATLTALSALVALVAHTPECMRVGRHAARKARGEAGGW
jgi:hypothetical protein